MKLVKSSWLERPPVLAFVLLIPTLVLVFGVLLYPILYTLWLSFTDLRLSAPSSGSFIGLGNYIEALKNPEFLAAMRRTVYFALVTVPVETVLGLVIALVLNQKFVGRGFVRGLVILPWALPYVVNGAMWKWIYNANYGALNALLHQLGLIEKYQIWLGNPRTAFALVMLANIWKETPVAAILIQAALQNISAELYEAARVDGAGVFRRFFHITLPLLRPVIAVTMVVKTVWALKEFDLIYVITQGGPANATSVATYYTYLNTFKFLRFGYGSALAFILVAVSLVIALLYVKVVSVEQA